MSFIEFNWQDLVTSTSDQVIASLKNGKPEPFAIAAGVQTMGRGRRGSAWESQDGGIYLSLALPWIRTLSRGLHSIYAAGVVAFWLKKRFGVDIQIKWPNDLILSGKKLGGILCESFTTDDEFSPLILGIGINIKNPPPNLGDHHYQSFALNEVVVVTDPLKLLCFELTHHFSREWFRTISSEDVQSLYSQFVPPRVLWANSAGEIFQEKKIENDGSLVLVSLEEPQKAISLVSSHHDFHLLSLNKMDL